MVQKLNASSAPPPVDESIEEPIVPNPDNDGYNVEDDYDDDDEDAVMRVMQESAEPLPVRHDTDVRWQGR